MGRNDQDHGNAEQDAALDSNYIPDLNDKAMEKRIVRKIDMQILPFICISYLINYLDRVSHYIPPCELQQPTYTLLGQLGKRTHLEQRHPLRQYCQRARSYRQPLQHRRRRLLRPIRPLRSAEQLRYEILLSFGLDRSDHDKLGYYYNLHGGRLQLRRIVGDSILPRNRRGRLLPRVR